jgi:hypothetical protein
LFDRVYIWLKVNMMRESFPDKAFDAVNSSNVEFTAELEPLVLVEDEEAARSKVELEALPPLPLPHSAQPAMGRSAGRRLGSFTSRK